MKAARFFPLAFLANIHGFALLVPYLALFMTAVWIATAIAHRAKMRAVPVRAIAEIRRTKLRRARKFE
jgi:hypothetical protein